MKDNRLIDRIALKKRIVKDVKDYTAKIPNMPRMVSILVGDTPEADVYVRNQAHGAEQAGLPFEQLRWSASTTQDECKQRILLMNDDPDVLGIIL